MKAISTENLLGQNAENCSGRKDRQQNLVAAMPIGGSNPHIFKKNLLPVFRVLG